MMVERLTYAQAVERWEAMTRRVEDAEDNLAYLRKRLAHATAEMFHALYERLEEPLP